MWMLLGMFVIGALPIVLLYMVIFQPKVLLAAIGAIITFFMTAAFGMYLFLCTVMYLSPEYDGPFFQDAITPIMEMFEEESEEK